MVVIEDDPLTADLLSDVLTEAGYTVSVLDSTLGVHAAVRRLLPCAIVLDLGLPYRSGASLLQDLKADPVTAPVPVVIVSALADSLPQDRAALASAVVAKPFAPQALLDVVHAATTPSRPAA